jgi:Zn-dependent M28 family amino/carboxypeptidase
MKTNSLLVRMILLILFLSGIVSGCQPSGQTELPPVDPTTAAPTITPEPSQTPAPTLTPTPARFNSARAYSDVEQQVAFGPRVPGSEAHSQTVDWIQAGLQESGWQVELQETTYRDQPVRNVIARRDTTASGDWIILGAHYDSRLLADRHPEVEMQQTPVPGANDGASGVAVLMELARVLPADLEDDVWLVFFDVEDQGRIDGWDWILGSRAFAESLDSHPDAVVVVDMIGDADLNLYFEHSSNQALSQEIWAVAASQGHGSVFIPEPKYSILDDHTPFLELGIPAVDIIDFDYPYWHTLEDTPDKVSPDSLEAVGDTLYHWLTGIN